MVTVNFGTDGEIFFTDVAYLTVRRTPHESYIEIVSVTPKKREEKKKEKKRFVGSAMGKPGPTI